LTTYERRGGDILANSTSAGHQDGGQVVYLTDGRFVIVWRDSSATGGDTSGTAIRGQIFNSDGTRSGEEFLVNTSTSGFQNSPTLFALPSGGFVVAWTDSLLSATDAEVRAQMFDSAGAKSGAEILVNTVVSGIQNGPSGAALADGSFVLAWTDATAEPAVPNTGGSPIGVRAQLFDAAGAKVGAETAVNTTTRYEQSNPSVAALAGGGYVIVWQDVNSGGIVGQRFASDGTPIAGEFLISTILAGSQLDASVAALSGGGFVVTWTDGSGIGGDTHYTGVKAQIYDSAGAKVGGEFLANSDTQGYQQYSFVTPTPSGGFLVMWSNTTSTVSDGSGSGVKAQYFDAAGVREGGEFWVNSTKLNDQFGSGIAASANGVVAVFADLSGTGGDSSGSSVKFDHFILAPGTEDADVLTGTDAEDTIHGFGGDDAISGAGAADLLDGGDGDDVLTGGAGDDDLFGGAGMDDLIGEGGADVLNGDDGDDSLDGGDGGDGLAGGEGDDILAGGIGNDTLMGGNGHDQLDGGEGDDDLFYHFLVAAPDHDQAAGGAGVDALFVDFGGFGGSAGVTMSLSADPNGGHSGLISAGADHSAAYSSIELFFIATTDFADQILTGSGNDLIFAEGGNDVVETGAGNDHIVGGAGADEMRGGEGNDRYEVDDAGDAPIENAGEGTDEIQVALAAYALGANFENLTGLLGTGQTLTGNDSANVIKGGFGNDAIDGGAGADTMFGGGGNDIYHVDNAGDTVADGLGTDEIRVSLATYSIAANIDIENLTGTSGSGQALTGNDLVNRISGGGGNDVIAGGVGFDQLLGGGGDDRLDGGAGVDTMTGGDGNDIYVVDVGNDVVVEAEDGGIDEVLVGSAMHYALAANVENATAVGGAWHMIDGNALDNVLRGDVNSDWLDGKAGDDTMIGGKGYDTYYVDSLGDVIVEEDDDFQSPAGPYGDTVVTSLAEYTLRSDLEKLNGDGSQQRLVGNDKDNELWSVGGSDTLVGGKGNDYYIILPGDIVVELEGEGTDTVHIGSGNYTLGDTLENLAGGSSSGQTLTGNIFANRITASSGADTIDGGAGADQMDGGGGNDIYYVDEAGDSITEATSGGTDEVRTALAAYTLGANIENFRGLSATGQTVTGTTLSNAITGGEGDDVFRVEIGGTDVLRRGGTDIVAGNGGNDLFVFGAGLTGADQANGGSGTDTLVLQGNYANLALAANTVQGIETLSLLSHTDSTYGGASAGPFAYRLTSADGNVAAGATLTVDAHLLASTESLNFSGAAETNGRFVLLGGRGADTLTGGAGADLLDGGAGNDAMAGGKGDDVYIVSESQDQVTELFNEGSDEVRTGLATYTLGENLEKLTGLWSVGQTLIGNGLANTITGADGQDFLDGRGGDDVLRGGLGNDYYFIDSIGDQVIENAGEGTDEVRSALFTYTLLANFENLTAFGSGPQTLIGNNKANIIAGGSYGDRLDGGAGADVLEGWQGHDVYVVDNAGDDVREQTNGGDDLVETSLAAYTLGAHVEYLTGTSASGQALTGNAGSNVIRGGSGADVLAGGGGDNDTIYGNGGDDRFLVGFAPQVHAIGGDGIDTLVVNYAAATGAVTMFHPIGLSHTGDNGGYLTAGGFVSFSQMERIDITTGNFADDVQTGAGDDRVVVNGGDDVVSVGRGNDFADGGAGTDVISADLEAATAGIVWNLQTNSYSGPIGNFSNFEYFGQVWTGSGNDGIVTAAGRRNENIYLRAGNDSATVIDGSDYVSGGTGTDTLTVDWSSATTSIRVYSLTSSLDGWSGRFSDDSEAHKVSFDGIDKLIIKGGSAIDHFAGAEGADLLEGGGGGDYLAGQWGNDTIDGGIGDDHLYGGYGDDLFLVDSAGDDVGEDALAGTDEVRTAIASYTLTANVENLTGTAATGQVLSGNALGNVVRAGDGADTFRLHDGGNDQAFGGWGNDVFWFGAEFDSADFVDGDQGRDEVVLQGGGYGALTIGAGMLAGIQSLTLLSAGDDRFGAASASPASYDYNITVAAGALSSAGYLMDEIFDYYAFALLIDGRGLAAGESLTVDASALGDRRAALAGGAGDDRLAGGAGADSVVDGIGGDDILEGGAGDDLVQDVGGGTDLLRGGEGDDSLYLFRAEGTALSASTLEGGAGADTFRISTWSAAAATVDAGAGDDRVLLEMVTGSARLTLGGGRDSISLSSHLLLRGEAAAISVTDFGTGANGDRIEWASDLHWKLIGWTEGSNPFASGHARLVQSGADTLLQLSERADGNFYTLLKFENRQATDFTGENFDGWSPLPLSGGAGSDQLTGTPSSDFVSGGDGNDFILLHQGGDDLASGGTGNDVFLFGGALNGADKVDGGSGVDQVAIQGDYWGAEALTLGSNVAGIENVAILPGDDTRFGDPGTNLYDYELTTTDSVVAAGVQLVVDANRLRAGEDFTFDGSAESDGSFFIYGGAGVDHLTGGAKNDVFLFGAWGQWNPADVVVGGSGIDQLALRGNYSLTFGAGQLAGIENIGLLSAHDTRFGALGSSYSYDLTMVDGNVASGVQMTVDGAKLRVAEFFRFDGSAELDGSFRVFGGLVDDTIIGSRNDDFLQGNGGIDTLTGRLGADTFRYLSASDSAPGAADKILDFTPGTDKIDLTRIDANSHSAGDQAFSWIGSNAFTGSGAASAGELRAFQSGASWFVEGDTDGDGNADLLIDLTLMGPTPLGAGDFVL
jgi:Ca2+-binding RTX toxin-like protein